jgi:hypothetical protein
MAGGPLARFKGDKPGRPLRGAEAAPTPGALTLDESPQVAEQLGALRLTVDQAPPLSRQARGLRHSSPGMSCSPCSPWTSSRPSNSSWPSAPASEFLAEPKTPGVRGPQVLRVRRTPTSPASTRMSPASRATAHVMTVATAQPLSARRLHACSRTILGMPVRLVAGAPRRRRQSHQPRLRAAPGPGHRDHRGDAPRRALRSSPSRARWARPPTSSSSPARPPSSAWST